MDTDLYNRPFRLQCRIKIDEAHMIRTKTFAWFGIALMVLFSALVVLPEDADARRFGGGSSFGGRGSRSFSTPRKAPQQRQATQQAPQRSGGGMKGAIMGGIGGLLIGGALGAMLFGGEGGGFGFLEILLLAGVAFLIWKVIRAKKAAKAAPGMARAAGTSFQQPVPGGFDKHAQSSAAPGGFGAQTDDVSAGVNQILAADPTFDEGQFLEGAKGAFMEIQRAWADWSIDRLRPLVTDRMWAMVEQQAGELKSKGERNILEKIQFLDVAVNEAWQESDSDYLSVRFVVSMVDYTLDAQGQVIDGSPNETAQVEEFWTFVRQSGSQGPEWFLTAVQQPGEVAKGAM